MKTATFTVLTKSGKEYKWNFIECEPDTNDYGNGIYIHVNTPSGDTSLIDCRYDREYDFVKSCVEYLTAYYGNNLDELSMDD